MVRFCWYRFGASPPFRLLPSRRTLDSPPLFSGFGFPFFCCDLFGLGGPGALSLSRVSVPETRTVPAFDPLDIR